MTYGLNAENNHNPLLYMTAVLAREYPAPKSLVEDIEALLHGQLNLAQAAKLDYS